MTVPRQQTISAERPGDLWAAYRETPTAALRQQIIEQYAPLAKYVVDRLNLTPSGGISYNDLIGQAIIGLIEAIDRFDPARGVKFNTFAYYRIRGAVLDMLREMDWVPRSLRAKSTELTNTIARLSTELGRQPTDQEVAAAFGITIDELDALSQEVGAQSLLSLDETIEQPDWDSHYAANEMVADARVPSPAAALEEDDTRQVLAELIDQLPKNERLVIALYYHEGLTLKEIGLVLGVTESRACQIHSKAIIRLRAMIKTAFPD